MVAMNIWSLNSNKLIHGCHRRLHPLYKYINHIDAIDILEINIYLNFLRGCYRNIKNKPKKKLMYQSKKKYLGGGYNAARCLISRKT